MRGKIKELPLIKLTLCLSLSFQTYLNKVKYSIYEKLSRVFSVAGFHYRDCERKPATSVPSNHFQLHLKPLYLVIYSGFLGHQIRTGYSIASSILAKTLFTGSSFGLIQYPYTKR